MKNFFAGFIIITLLSILHDGMAGMTGATPKKSFSLTRKETLKRSRALVEHSVFQIKDTIEYSYNYEKDEQNFQPDTITSIQDFKTTGWLVLINTHGPMELNLTSAYQTGTRTLSWATPLKWGINELTSLESHHEKLALLKSWSQGKYRKYISFIFIPPHTTMTFKIGEALAQSNDTEHKGGSGIQLRLRDLPKKTIVVTLPILSSSGSQKRVSKAEKKIKLIPLLRAAVQLADMPGLNMETISDNVPSYSMQIESEGSYGLLPDSDSKLELIKSFLEEFFVSP